MATNSCGIAETSIDTAQTRARVILQQCLSARLMVKPATDTQEAQYVHIKAGLIIYLCFLKGADEQMLDKMVKTILGAKLSENEEGKRVSILELPGDILIIPQATLGGILKGKSMQYHKNINKEAGLDLYSRFVQLCEETIGKNEKCREKQTCVKYGADEQMLDKMVKTILGAKLSENEEGKRVSILELPGDILIIPQATLGGNLKGKSMQYHKNINKEAGLDLYSKFVQLCQETIGKNEKCREKQTCVKYGTYGNRQVFSTETNGPYTHLLEF